MIWLNMNTGTLIYRPTNITALNRNDKVIIPVYTQDCYILSCKSYILITGKISKTTNADYDENVAINGFAHLFADIKFLINGEIIDRTRNPGFASFIKEICSYNDLQTKNFNTALTDSSKEVKLLKNGHFNVSIPLSHLPGSAEGFEKVLINGQTELVMLRAKTT